MEKYLHLCILEASIKEELGVSEGTENPMVASFVPGPAVYSVAVVPIEVTTHKQFKCPFRICCGKLTR